MCIYLKNRNDLKYDSAEHIIPAALGGIKKLPPMYVSKEFNNNFSKLEQKFLRDSILSLPRQILGPGKRGSRSVTKQTKSKVSVFRDFPHVDILSLGYVSMNKPKLIPYFISNNNGVSVGMDREGFEEDLKDFITHLLDFESLKTKLIKFDELEEDTYLLGIKNGVEENFNCFIASKRGDKNPFNREHLISVANWLQSIKEEPLCSRSHVRVNQTVKHDDDYFRCCAKIAFNVLADAMGKDFVLQGCFDPIRNWITNGGENDFVSMNTIDANIKIIFPQDSHCVIWNKVDNSLIANVTLYNHFQYCVRLCDNFTESINLDGFLCDWTNKKEYRLFDFLAVKTA